MSLKNFLKDIAPTLATAVGGSIGGPIGAAALRHLSLNLLGNETASQKEIENFLLTSNPDQLARIKEIDNDFKHKMESLGVDIRKIDAEDRKDARLLARASGVGPHIALTLIFIGGFFGLLFIIFAGVVTLDPSVRDSANILLGIIAAGVPTILKFWFGGSQHDEKNLDRIHNSIPK